MGVIDKTIFSVGHAVFQYFHLWDWFKKKVALETGHVCKRIFNSTNDLWDSLLTGDIKEGDLISISDVFVTDWIPRAPGGIHLSAKSSPIENFSTFGFSTMPPKTSISEQLIPEIGHGWEFSYKGRRLSPSGFGSVRLPLPAKNEDYIVLGAVSAEQYFCDAGIPILMTKACYTEFERKRQKENAVASEFYDVAISSIPFSVNTSFARLGVNLPPFIADATSCTLGIPKYCLILKSPLEAKFFTHSSHPVISAWTMGTVSNSKYKRPLFLTANLCDPTNREHMEYVCSDLSSGGSAAFFGEDVLEPALFEFDGRVHRLPARFTLDRNHAKLNPLEVKKLFDLALAMLEKDKFIKAEHGN